MKLRRYILLSIYVAVSTQQQLPSCAQTCLNRTPTTCVTGDTLCRCSSAEFVSGVSCCIIVNCGPVDQEAAGARLSAQCLSVGVTVPSNATCPSTSRTSTSASTAQPLTTPSTSPPAPVTDSGTASSTTVAVSSTTSSSSTSSPSRTGTGVGDASSASTSVPSATPSSSSSSSLSAGAIAGTAVGALIGVAILILAVVLARRRRPTVDKRADSPSLHGPEFGDAILESDLVQIPQQFVTPLQQPAIAELPSPLGPPKLNGSPHMHPGISELGQGSNGAYRGSREMTPTASVPTTAVSELPSDRDPGESTFDSRELSPISPVSRAEETDVMTSLNGDARVSRSRGT